MVEWGRFLLTGSTPAGLTHRSTRRCWFEYRKMTIFSFSCDVKMREKRFAWSRIAQDVSGLLIDEAFSDCGEDKREGEAFL